MTTVSFITVCLYFSPKGWDWEPGRASHGTGRTSYRFQRASDKFGGRHMGPKGTQTQWGWGRRMWGCRSRMALSLTLTRKEASTTAGSLKPKTRRISLILLSVTYLQAVLLV